MMALMLVAQLSLGSAKEEVEGLTPDGKFLVGQTNESSYYDERITLWYEQIGGERTTFDQSIPEEKAEFEKWRKAIKKPLVPLVAGRTSPDGKTTIDVVMNPRAAPPSKDGEWLNASEVTIVARTGTRKLELFSTSASFSVAWTPDSRGLIITTRTPTVDQGPRGSVTPTIDESLSSWVPSAPSINCVAPTRKLALAASPKFAEFSNVDLNVRYGVARKQRDRTVIYARKEQEPLAKKLAPKFAATVEPLTWDSPFDLVVALGGAK
ncbi:MAG: hypothetical protein QM817_20375 [Archangium sp.]